MKTPNVYAKSETESWICHQLCSGFLLIVQWIAVLICWRKQKNIAVFAWFDTIIEGQEFSTVIPDTSSCFEEKSASKTKFGVLFASGALIDV